MKKTLKTTAMVLAIAVLLGISGFTIYKVESDNARSVAVAVISQGSRGETVKLIQQKLKRWGYYNGAIDGIYGSATKKAVKNFQSKNGLTADGIVGNKTLAALGISLSGSSQTSNSGTSYSNTDVTLLARLIYGEAPSRRKFYRSGCGRRGRYEQS